MKLEEQISKRRTFGIISHPDAGKTTLTEKLLLFGGAIQIAGAVKSNKIKKTATSDFMEIEKQRGISVATSVMGFEYKDYKINILDTPGHKDFAEDTYRTLTAVDSVILVIDSVKGVEEQTRKLMEVCRMRHTPVIIFINKLDREGQDPFTLLDEIEKELGINVRPLTWPIGMGKNFKGVFNIHESKLQLVSSENSKLHDNLIEIKDLKSSELDSHIGETNASKLREDAELVSGIYEPYDKGLYKEGYLAPVFFGSAINNFGVKELLDTFVKIGNEPMPRPADKRIVEPSENKFTGFIFKIHANLDPNHRDRIAFCRIVSGKFERNVYYHHTLGHTLGHALEAHSKWNLPHGVAVARGLHFALSVARSRGHMDAADAQRSVELLNLYGFTADALPPTKELTPFLTRDKKRLGDELIMALPTGIGTAEQVPVKLDELGDLLQG